MVWDLRSALLKKGEMESARLDEFAFRERARTMRLLAREIASSETGGSIDPTELASLIAVQEDEGILAYLLTRFPELDPDELREAFFHCRAIAHDMLIEEIGDPTPHRLA